MTQFAYTWEWLFRKSPYTNHLKTETRRLVKAGQFLAVSNWWVLSGSPTNEIGARVIYEVAKTYAIQPGRGKPTIFWDRTTEGKVQTSMDDSWLRFEPDFFEQANWKPGRFKLLRLAREDVRSISDEDARREGFRNALHFLEQWSWIHDPGGAFIAFEDGRTFRIWTGRQTKWQIGDQSVLRAHLTQRPAALYDAWVLDIQPPVVEIENEED